MTTVDMRCGAGRINAQQQITIPAEALRAAGLEVGDCVVVHAEADGRVVLERDADAAGNVSRMASVFRAGELEALRAEWD
jgi:bifunctional DNA-binding transcriptional regulator/antitoxin component of YhaV-PrlF toxin-antitoxin module